MRTQVNHSEFLFRSLPANTEVFLGATAGLRALSVGRANIYKVLLVTGSIPGPSPRAPRTLVCTHEKPTIFLRGASCRDGFRENRGPPNNTFIKKLQAAPHLRLRQISPYAGRIVAR